MEPLRFAMKKWQEAQDGNLDVHDIRIMDNELRQSNATRSDIGVTNEQVEDIALREALNYWEDAQDGSGVEEDIGHMDEALVMAQKNRSDIGATDDVIKQAALREAALMWSIATSRRNRINAYNQIEEMLHMLTYADNASPETIGITQDDIRQFAKEEALWLKESVESSIPNEACIYPTIWERRIDEYLEIAELSRADIGLDDEYVQKYAVRYWMESYDKKLHYIVDTLRADRFDSQDMRSLRAIEQNLVRVGVPQEQLDEKEERP